jgi:hypothetical protein
MGKIEKATIHRLADYYISHVNIPNTPSRKPSICLFSFRSEYTREYKVLLNKFNVRIIEIEKEEHCRVIMESIKCNGILLDIPTYIKSSLQTKEFLSNLGKIYPTARIRYNTERRFMELMVLEETNYISLQEFLENRCSNFDARMVRHQTRIAVNLNIRLFLEQENVPVEILCTSINVSENGLFILNRNGSLHMGAKVKIQILELGKNNFLRGTVVRILEWGEKHFQAPGFGIRIDSIDEEIYKDYIGLVSTHW